MCNVQALFTNGIIQMSKEEEIVEESLTLEFVLKFLVLRITDIFFCIAGLEMSIEYFKNSSPWFPISWSDSQKPLRKRL
jgi:hypothetical protein